AVEGMQEAKLEGDDQLVDLADRAAQGRLQQPLELGPATLADDQQAVGIGQGELLDLQQLDRWAEQLERRADQPGAEIAHIARQLGIAARPLGQEAERGEADGLARDQAVVAIHRVESKRERRTSPAAARMTARRRARYG